MDPADTPGPSWQKWKSVPAVIELLRSTRCRLTFNMTGRSITTILHSNYLPSQHSFSFIFTPHKVIINLIKRQPNAFFLLIIFPRLLYRRHVSPNVMTCLYSFVYFYDWKLESHIIFFLIYCQYEYFPLNSSFFPPKCFTLWTFLSWARRWHIWAFMLTLLLHVQFQMILYIENG